jgi:ABC-type dipeptide/oligopeptide/nickel transport system permease subunit
MGKIGTLNLLPRGQFTPLSQLTIPGLINAGINLILIIAVLSFLYSFLTGALKLMVSGGNKEKLDTAKRQLINAFLGLFFIFTIWAILSYVQAFFGIDLMTFEIPTL